MTTFPGKGIMLMPVPEMFKFNQKDVGITARLARALYLLDLPSEVTNGQRRHYNRRAWAEIMDIEMEFEKIYCLSRHPIGQRVTTEAQAVSLIQTEADLILRRRPGFPDTVQDEIETPYKVNLLYGTVCYTEYTQILPNKGEAVFVDIFVAGMDTDRAGKCAPLSEVTYLALDGLRVLNRSIEDDQRSETG